MKKQMHTLITESLVIDKSVLDTLEKQVQHMTELLSEGYEYKYEDETIFNKFIDINDINTLTELSTYCI